MVLGIAGTATWGKRVTRVVGVGPRGMAGGRDSLSGRNAGEERISCDMSIPAAVILPSSVRFLFRNGYGGELRERESSEERVILSMAPSRTLIAQVPIGHEVQPYSGLSCVVSRITSTMFLAVESSMAS